MVIVGEGAPLLTVPLTVLGRGLVAASALSLIGSAAAMVAIHSCACVGAERRAISVAVSAGVVAVIAFGAALMAG
jgi:hypothetical protein